MESGRNNGVTGLVDLPGLGLGAMFECRAYGYESTLTVASKPRRGRGDTQWQKSRPVGSGGSLALSMRIQLTGWPLPDKWRGQVGTVLLQLDEGRTEQHTVRVDSFARGYSERKGDVHDVTIGCAIVADPVFAGFADDDHPQPAATEPAKTDQEQWGEGTTKTYDGQGILTRATRLTDVWGGSLPDTDTGEAARLAAAVAAAQPPLQFLKLKTATFQRDADDGGTIAEEWALTTSAEDILNEINKVTLDANHLASTAVQGAINGTPATPAGDSFVTRTTTTSEINDQKTLTVVEFGLRDTKDDVEMPGSITRADLASLADDGTIVRVTSSATPPAAPAAPVGQHVGTDTVALNRLEWQHTFHYGNSTTAQALLFKDTATTADPTQLNDEDQQAALNTSATPPATPPPAIAGLKLRRRTSKRVSGTPVQWEHVFYFARTTTQEDVENPGTFTVTDVSDLRSIGRQTQVYDPAGGVPGASVPAGQQKVGTKIQELNDGRSAVVYDYAKDNPIQEEQQKRTFTVTDPQGLGSRQAVALVDGTPTVSGGFVSRGLRTEQLTHDHAVNTVEGGLRSEADDRTFPRTKIHIDRAGLGQETFTAAMVTTGAGLSVPAPPSAGMVLTDYFDVPETAAGTTNQSIRVYQWALVSNDQRLTLARYDFAQDPYGIETTLASAEAWDTAGGGGTPPATPDAPTGLKLRAATDVGIPSHPTKRVRVYRWARRSTADDLTHGNTYARGTWQDGQQDQTAYLVTSAADAADLCATVIAKNQDDPSFEGVEVEKVHDNLALVKLRTRDDTVLIEFEMRATGKIYSPARLIGNDVYVYAQYVKQVATVSGGVGNYEINIIPQGYAGVRMFFAITRRVAGGTLPLNLGYVGAVNGDAAFLGLPKNTVTYLGAGGRARVNGRGFAQGVSQMTYKFFYDSLGHYDLNDCAEGRFVVQAGSAGFPVSTKGAWRKAKDLGFAPALLPSADFTGSYT